MPKPQLWSGLSTPSTPQDSTNSSLLRSQRRLQQLRAASLNPELGTAQQQALAKLADVQEQVVKYRLGALAQNNAPSM